jgi:hypothetical protein
MKQSNSCSKIRRLLAARFDGVLFKVTSSKYDQNINNISIIFSNRSVSTTEVLGYLWDNGYDQFVVAAAGRLYTTVLVGYVSECNYSLAIFA